MSKLFLMYIWYQVKLFIMEKRQIVQLVNKWLGAHRYSKYIMARSYRDIFMITNLEFSKRDAASIYNELGVGKFVSIDKTHCKLIEVN